MNFVLTSRQEYAYTRIKQGANVFITGPGGVGKSVLVNRIREDLGEDTLFMAPTGVAALNIQGVTIHRQFGLPLGFISKSRAKQANEKLIELLKDKETITRIVIDEISMVRADAFTAVNEMCKKARKSRKPFGGLQVVLVGDFYQLPPVLNNRSTEYSAFMQEYKSVYAFSTESWIEGGFETIHLDEVLRTDDKDFIMLLQSIRQKDNNYKTALDAINSFCYDNYDNTEEDAIVLSTTNAIADKINEVNLKDLTSSSKIIYADKTGDVKIEPAPTKLELKEGARIMMLANNYEEGFMNGQLGYIVGFSGDKIQVLIDGHNCPIPVSKFKWDENEYQIVNEKLNLKTVGSFKQFPIRLAYAITIHKAQGVSLASAHINIGNGAFTHGQTYVALSRLRAMKSMNLMSKLAYKDIIVDEEVIKFYKQNKTANLLDFD